MAELTAKFYEIKNIPRVPFNIENYNMPDFLWEMVEGHVPKSKQSVTKTKFKHKTTSRIILSAIFYKLFTGEDWDALEIKKGCSPYLAYQKFLEYEKSGFFRKISNLPFPCEETEETGMQSWVWLNHTDLRIDNSTYKKPKKIEPLSTWEIVD